MCGPHHSVASRRMSSLNIGSNSTSAELMVKERWSCGLVGGAILKGDCPVCCRDATGACDLSVEVDGRLLERYGACAFSYILRGFCGKPWPEDCPNDELRGPLALRDCIVLLGCCEFSGLAIVLKT
jgi:hypothetical protein